MVVRASIPLCLVIVSLGACHRGPTGFRTAIPTLQIPHARGVIAVNGRLDEPDWSRAAETGDLVDTLSGAIGDPRNARGRVKVLWSETALYVAFVIEDTTPIDHGAGRTDPHLWEDDCAEVMLDPGGDARNYFELQVGPRGSMFDTRYVAPRLPRPFGQTNWSSGAERAVHASPNGYTVEMSIPWSAIDVATVHPGDDVRANFYLMDRTGPTAQRFAGWSPTRVGDFHVPSRFGHLVLAP